MDSPTPAPASPMSTSALLFGPPAAVPPATPSATPPATPSAPSGVAEAQPATTGPALEFEEPADPLEAITAELWEGPSSPGAYRFGTVPRDVEVDINQEVAFRAFFHEEGIPEGIGSELGRRWNEAVVRETASPQTYEQRVLAERACAVYLRNAWGEDAQKNLDVACAEVTRLSAKMPQLKEMLELSGMGNDPWTIISIFNLARGKGRAK